MPPSLASAANSYTPIPKSAEAEAAMLRDIQNLCTRYNLRAALLLHDGGRVYSYRFGIPGEDLRNEIISAANEIRTAVTKGAL